MTEGSQAMGPGGLIDRRSDLRRVGEVAALGHEIRGALRRTGSTRVLIVGSRRAILAITRSLTLLRVPADVTAFQVGPDPFDPLREEGWEVRPFQGPADVAVTARDGVPPAAVIDLRTGEREQRALWRLVMFTLATDGIAVCADRPGSDRHWAWPQPEPQDDAIAQEACRGLTVTHRPGYVVMRKQARHFLKLDERRSAGVLSRCCPDLSETVLARLPAQQVRSLAQIRHHGAEPADFPSVLHAPELTLRRWTGRISVLRHRLALHGHVVLPSSFRFPFGAFPVNPRLQHHSRDFASLMPDAAAQLGSAEHLPGAYFDASSAWPHHFGHWMTEVPSMLWGWHEAKRVIPDLRALVSVRPDEEATFEVQTLRAFGIADGDIVVTREPVQVDELVTATQGWQNQDPFFAHPAVTGPWRAAGDALAGDLEPGSERVFVTRRPTLNRHCHQTEELEQWFADRGFRVVRPEEMPLRDQVALFRSSAVLAGLAGSGLFNLMFTTARTRVVVLSSDAYLARNEHLITSLLGHRIDYFWGPSDVAHPPGGVSQQAQESTWSFDLTAHASALETAIAS